MIKFKEVTWYSKLAAAIFFIGILPTLTFYTGAQYGEVTGKLEMTEIFLPSPQKIHPKDTLAIQTKNDKAQLIGAAYSVLSALETKDYGTLAALSSSAGLSFNETPNLDLAKIDVQKSEISKIPSNKQAYLFGYTDGKGDPITKTLADYLYTYIYNHDYAKADMIGVDTLIDNGSNSLNTLIKDIGGRRMVAFHFKGFDKKYEGLDWTTLYLVLEKENNTYVLRGMAKNNWTI